MASVDDGLRELIARGFRFLHRYDDQGELTVIVGLRRWPQVCDQIHLYGEDEAIAARVPLDAPQEVMWSHQGDAQSTVAALLELPDPQDPTAPRRQRRGPPGLWLPGTAGGLCPH